MFPTARHALSGAISLVVIASFLTGCGQRDTAPQPARPVLTALV